MMLWVEFSYPCYEKHGSSVQTFIIQAELNYSLKTNKKKVLQHSYKIYKKLDHHYSDVTWVYRALSPSCTAMSLLLSFWKDEIRQSISRSDPHKAINSSPQDQLFQSHWTPCVLLQSTEFYANLKLTSQGPLRQVSKHIPYWNCNTARHSRPPVSALQQRRGINFQWNPSQLFGECYKSISKHFPHLDDVLESPGN